MRRLKRHFARLFPRRFLNSLLLLLVVVAVAYVSFKAGYLSVICAEQPSEHYIRPLQVMKDASLSPPMTLPPLIRQKVLTGDDFEPQGAPKHKGSKVIVMTHASTGASLASNILQQDPRVFYLFEPLFHLVEKYLGKTEARRKTFFQNETEEVQADFNKNASELLDTFLACDFSSLDIGHISNDHLSNSADGRLLWDCLHLNGSWTPVQVLDCFNRARRTCLSRSVKIVKTIRLRGTEAKKLMAKHEDLKILYFVRDPRGTLTSHRKVFDVFGQKDPGKYSYYYCKMFREDLALIGELADEYPQRTRVFRYESLVGDPLRVSKEMFDFLGLDFTSRVENFVVEQFVANQTKSGILEKYSPEKNPALAVAYSWRKEIGLLPAKQTDGNCLDIYYELGYKIIKTKTDLKNMSYSLLKPVQFHGHWL